MENTEMVKKFTFTWCGVYLALTVLPLVPVNEVWVTRGARSVWLERGERYFVHELDDTSGYIHATLHQQLFPITHNAFAWRTPSF